MSQSVGKIEDVVWKSCEMLRGVVEAPRHAQYVLALLFLKILCDKAGNTSKTGCEVGNMRRGELVIPRSCATERVFSFGPSPFLGKSIDSVLFDLEKRNPAALGGVFRRNVSFGRLAATPGGERALYVVLSVVSQLDMRSCRLGDSDLANMYEGLLERLSFKDKRGEFDTPQGLASLVARLLNPFPRCSVYDPACKRGSMLAAVAREFGAKECSFSGQESNVSSWYFCKLGMLMCGVPDADILCASSLEDPITDESGGLKKYDFVISNPPFGSAAWGADRWQLDAFGRFSRGIPPKSRSEYAFLMHMIESAKDLTGEVVALLPPGALFRQGSEQAIRKAIIEENLVQAVVALPANLFYGTGIPVALVVLSKKKSSAGVLFVDASREFGSQAGRNYLRDDHVSKIVAAVRKFEAQESYCCRVSIEDVRKREYNLSVGQYVQGEQRGVVLSVAVLEREIREAEEELGLVQQDLRSHLDNLLG